MDETDGQGAKPPKQKLPVLLKAFDLAREMTRRTRKMPRDLKFVLGDRILTASYDVLDLLIEANYSRNQARRATCSAERTCC